MKSYFKLCLFLPFTVIANTCPVDVLAPYTWGNDTTDSLVHVSADVSESTNDKVSFEGNVHVTRGQEMFKGEQLQYNRQSENINSTQNATYGNPNFAIRSKGSTYNLDSQSGTFDGVEYYLVDGKVIGQAEQLKVDRIANSEDLKQATYSTCPRLNPSWYLKAKELHLDHAKEEGIARHTTFYIRDIPILYLPYLSFPLSDKRKTGFLFPQANLSEDRGVDITTPFYINISPNQDATIYPRLMSKRGFMLGGEYRYLLPKLVGTVNGRYLAHDASSNDKRWSLRTKHNYSPSSQLHIEALLQRVSDKNYIETFENTLDLSSDNFIESHLNAYYRPSPNYQFFAQLQSYQVANSGYTEANKPYSRLPRLEGKGKWFLNDSIAVESETQLTNFQKNDDVSGIRFDQELALSYFYRTSYSFFNPRLAYRFSFYDLTRQLAGKDDEITRSIPILSVDTGLYFDREINWLGRSSTQSLEPRLFYLNAPYKNQSDIPNFDSAIISSSYDWLFLSNRFNGRDRIGDSNQLTTAVSTTITNNETGKEKARLAVGQIQYFQNRKVSLLDSVADTSHSSIIAEGNLALNDRLKARGLIHRNIDNDSTEKSILGLQYKAAVDKQVNLSHLYDQTYYKQLDLSGIWRIDDSWRTFWRWNYSIKYNKSIDVMAGIEYADCCWAVRLVARQNRDSLISNSTNNISDDTDTSVYLEFVLNGLGNVGSDTGTLLTEVIPGYMPLKEERK